MEVKIAYKSCSTGEYFIVWDNMVCQVLNRELDRFLSKYELIPIGSNTFYDMFELHTKKENNESRSN